MHRLLRRFSLDSNPGWVFILPSLVLIGLLGLPLLALVWRAIGRDFLGDILSPTALSALRLSLLTSTASVLIAVATGTPLAYILARWNFKGKTAFELLIDLPVVLPPSVAGLALLIAFGRQGVFGAWLSAIGITLPFTTAAVVVALIAVGFLVFAVARAGGGESAGGYTLNARFNRIDGVSAGTDRHVKLRFQTVCGADGRSSRQSAKSCSIHGQIIANVALSCRRYDGCRIVG